MVMQTLFAGQYCIELDKTDSTNSYLARLAGEKELPEGTVVITQAQEQGRGQRGTHWESEPGKNLTFSILLKPHFLKPDEQFNLSKAVALAVWDFVASLIPYSLFLIPKIKWPNDIYIGTKKVAGILIENSVSGSSLSHSIVGVGININQEVFSDVPANPTSLKIITGKEFDLDNCLSEVCKCIEKRYLQLRSGSQEINSEYLKNLYRFDEWGNYNYKGENMKAKITGVSGIGKLILREENEKSIECEVKEVTFL